MSFNKTFASQTKDKKGMFKVHVLKHSINLTFQQTDRVHLENT